MRISNGKQTYINLEDKEYNKLLDRLDNALIKNESLQDEIKEQSKRIDNINYMYDILEDKNKALKEDKKELEKDVEFYRSKVKVLLEDMVQFGRQAYVKSINNDINLGNKGGK